MAAQKCKNKLLQAVLKDFWSSANLKLKKISLSKLSLLYDYIYWKKSKNGDSREILLFASDFKYCSTVSFQKKLKFEGLQTYERHESHLIMS